MFVSGQTQKVITKIEIDVLGWRGKGVVFPVGDVWLEFQISFIILRQISAVPKGKRDPMLLECLIVHSSQGCGRIYFHSNL